MKIEVHQNGGIKIAEVISDSIIVTNAEEALQLMVDLYYQDFDKIIIHEPSITPDFFDLKTGIAGEVLQKFSNYGQDRVSIPKKAIHKISVWKQKKQSLFILNGRVASNSLISV